jgi:Na+-translocating ferredoxin:NAD+ oxidoreductase subunit G
MNARALAWLGACALVAALVLGGVHALTRERIAAEQHRQRLAELSAVMPPSVHDNDPLADEIILLAPAWLGAERPLRAWRARRGGMPSALVLETVARDGYTGPIELRVGVDTQGRLLGVRVTRHRETPGLGDWIEAGKSDWIARFTGKSLDNPPRERWTVGHDGGDFDQFAGATITPRAVVRTVERTLEYVAKHGAEIHAAPAGSTLEHADAPEN